MSWGIPNRLKKILGFAEEMNLEAPWLDGADDEASFSNRDLAKHKDTRTVEQKASDNMKAIQEKFFGNPNERHVATTDLPKKLTDIKSDRKEKVAEMNDRYGKGY